MKNALKKQPKTAEDHSVDTLLLEIKEEIKRDEMVKLVKKHSGLAITLVVLLVVGVALFQVYEYYTTKSTQEAGGQFLSAMQSEEPNFGALDKAAENGNFADLATLSKANLLIETGDTKKALKTYEQVAQKADQKIFRDLATLNIANLLLNTDSGNQKIEAELKSLVDSNSHFSYSAKDLLAVYYIQNNKKDEAKKILNDLAQDPNAPVTISHRAKQLLSTI